MIRVKIFEDELYPHYEAHLVDATEEKADAHFKDEEWKRLIEATQAYFAWQDKLRILHDHLPEN